MKALKRLAIASTLVGILAMSAIGGETPTGPCPPGETPTGPCACVPGETHSPPCSSQSVNAEPVVPGETDTPPAQPMVDVTNMTQAVLWALSLF